MQRTGLLSKQRVVNMEKWRVSLFFTSNQLMCQIFLRKWFTSVHYTKKKARLVFILCITAEAQGQALCNRLGFGFYVMPVWCLWVQINYSLLICFFTYIQFQSLHLVTHNMFTLWLKCISQTFPFMYFIWFFIQSFGHLSKQLQKVKCSMISLKTFVGIKS